MKKIVLNTLTAICLSHPALADDAWKAGDFMVRVRALGVVPQESSDMNIAAKTKVDNSVVPELDFTYFFTPNISAELIAAVTPHDVKTNTGVDAGSSWLLPPTLTLQYHFTQLGAVKPYVGAGLNYTHFFNADAGALNAVKYEDSFGTALQVGVDIPIQGNWYANIDVKKVFISTTAKFNPSNVRTDVDINPWLIGVGVGYKF
ncbi:MAG: OmpW family outer membrane protein [Rickettsiales bacterium]|nr:OmpW family outer membrane protein [Rickettsiales bacterium]